MDALQILGLQVDICTFTHCEDLSVQSNVSTPSLITVELRKHSQRQHTNAHTWWQHLAQQVAVQCLDGALTMKLLAAAVM